MAPCGKCDVKKRSTVAWSYLQGGEIRKFNHALFLLGNGERERERERTREKPT
jgi:hypothetical protein